MVTIGTHSTDSPALLRDSRNLSRAAHSAALLELHCAVCTSPFSPRPQTHTESRKRRAQPQMPNTDTRDTQNRKIILPRCGSGSNGFSVFLMPHRNPLTCSRQRTLPAGLEHFRQFADVLSIFGPTGNIDVFVRVFVVIV